MLEEKKVGVGFGGGGAGPDKEVKDTVVAVVE